MARARPPLWCRSDRQAGELKSVIANKGSVAGSAGPFHLCATWLRQCMRQALFFHKVCESPGLTKDTPLDFPHRAGRYIQQPMGCKAFVPAPLVPHEGKQREQVAHQTERHNALVAGAQAPSNRGEIFAGMPRLCYRVARRAA